jgi:TonB family protein
MMHYRFRSIALRLFSHAGILAFLSVMPALCQSNPIAHFVTPKYPPLARQIMVSGQVALQLQLASDGEITEVLEKHSAHPLFSQEAKEVVQKWRFHHTRDVHHVSVVFHFGFSGVTRRDNPSTVVAADFESHAIRVYVTTDGVTTVHPLGRVEQ